MDDYERMLSIDRVARELGITPTQVEKEIEAFSSDGFTPDTPQDFTAAAGVPSRESKFESAAEPIEGRLNFLRKLTGTGLLMTQAQSLLSDNRMQSKQ